MEQLTKAQLLLRWSRNVAQVEFSFWMGVPLFNALFLGNPWEYHRKLYIAEIRFFGYIFVADGVGL